MPRSFTNYQRKLLLLSRKRIFTDSIVCFLLFLLIIGFTTIILWHHYETMHLGHQYTNFIDYLFNEHQSERSWIAAFSVIISTSLVFLLILMVTAYVNLFIIKRITLDSKKINKPQRYGLYILALLIVTTLFTVFWYSLNNIFNNDRSWVYIRLNLGPYVSFMAQFAFSIAATGLVYLRELNQKERKLGFLIISKQKLTKRLQETEEKFELIKLKLTETQKKLEDFSKIEANLEEVTQELEELRSQEDGDEIAGFNDTHIKIGNKNSYIIIKYEDIFYIKSNNNGAVIHLNDHSSPIETKSKGLKEYQEGLEKYQQKNFLRVHRQYIIAIQLIQKREEDFFILKSPHENITKKIPIGTTYEEAIDTHLYLKF